MRLSHVLSGTLFGVCLAASAVASADEKAQASLSAFRAVYDMKLDDRIEAKGVEDASGRLVYETTGNACEGYTVKARQVINLQSESGQRLLDSVSDTYESGDGKTMRFRIKSKMDGATIEDTDGEAILDGGKLQVRLSRPQAKKISWKGEMLLPTMLSEKVIEAARAGQSTFSARTYDGTGGGEALYDTLTIIGHRIAPGDGVGLEEAALAPELRKLPRWPVKISYFKRNDAGGEQVPEYAMTAELYENGVTRAMRLSFPEFTVKAEMKSVTFLPVSACPKK